MAVVNYSKRQLIQRIEKHFSNNFPGEDWKITEKEMLLYIDTALPYVLKGQLFENAKITSVFDVPEAYLVTYSYTISNQSPYTNEYFVTLAQPPLSLPTGYDITECYVADASMGQSTNGFAISAKRSAYRRNLPQPPGFLYRIEGNRMYLKMNDGSSMLDLNLSVQLPVSRTDDLDAELRLPDDAINAIFDSVVAKIGLRYQIPQDTVKDNLMPGNKTS